MKRLKVLNALACEYVGLGAYSKHTLVNVYTGDILVKEFPATFPMAFYLEIQAEETGTKEITVTLMQGKKQKAKLTIDFPFEIGKVALLTLPQLPFSFSKNTEIRVIASGENIAPTVLIKKKVSVGNIPPG